VKIMGASVCYDPKNIQLVKRDHLLKYLPKSQDELPVRSMQDSFEAAIIPLANDLDLRDKMVTVQGFVRLGRFMEIMDLFAGELEWINFKSVFPPHALHSAKLTLHFTVPLNSMET
jgi:hypothetical protein